MLHQTEAKAQCWRAIAIFNDERAEALVVVGRSSTQVRETYLEAYTDLFDEEEKEHIESMELQRWHGAPDAGQWLTQAKLKLPAQRLVGVAAA